MDSREIRVVSLVGSVALAGLLFHGTMNAKESLDRVNEAQERINNSLTLHINTFHTLEAETQGWDDGLRDISRAQDLVGMYQLMDLERFGLSASIDTFQLVSAAPYMVAGTDIGVIEVCVDGGGNGSLPVQARDYQSLVQGLEHMAGSGEFRFSYVNIEGGTSEATALVGDLCLLFKAAPEGEV